MKKLMLLICMIAIAVGLSYMPADASVYRSKTRASCSGVAVTREFARGRASCSGVSAFRSRAKATCAGVSRFHSRRSCSGG